MSGQRLPPGWLMTCCVVLGEKNAPHSQPPPPAHGGKQPHSTNESIRPPPFHPNVTAKAASAQPLLLITHISLDSFQQPPKCTNCPYRCGLIKKHNCDQYVRKQGGRWSEFRFCDMDVSHLDKPCASLNAQEWGSCVESQWLLSTGWNGERLYLKSSRWFAARSTLRWSETH